MKKVNNIISSKNIITLVTASGKINSACDYKLSTEDAAFINIGSSLAIDEIKKKIISNIILTTKNKNSNCYRFNPFKGIQLYETGETNCITDTISKALENITTSWCLINPITTIPSTNNFDKAFIEFGLEMIHKENWSSLIQDNNEMPLFINKTDIKYFGIKSHPFTGRIFARTDDIRFQIKKLKESEKDDLIYLAKKLFKHSRVEIRYTNWLDIGHQATYPITRISSITSRFFNTLTFDKNKNTIKKKSQNKTKLKNEIFFYKTIPDEYKRFFPIIFNTKKDKKEISYEMEYINKPNLSEIFLFSKVGPISISRIFYSLKKVFDTFYNKESLSTENASWLYSLKTFSRQRELEKLIKDNEFKSFEKIYESDFTLNNNIFPSLRKTYSLLFDQLKDFEFNRPLHIGHGDLCFNNILVDHLYGKIHLIDPKAERHKDLKKYGLIDNFYDLSKLNHSIEGLYDSIVNNLFKLTINDFSNINLEIYKPHEYETYNHYFKEIIIYKRISKECLKMLTGNLFLSMLPMHIDNEEKLISLALLGSILISNHKIKDLIL